MSELIAQTEFLVFKRSPIHGIGGFAAQELRSRQKIIEYVGDVISKAESLKRCEADNQYIFSLNDLQDLDGDVEWNPARYINHSCEPNCEAELDKDHIWIITVRDIKAGEEITFNYGYDLAEYKDYPCHCGAPGCVGFIVAEEFFPHLRAQAEYK